MAMSGERSSQALPTPVARLVAPGPSVAMQSPGFPVMRPVTSAAKPAEPSCAVSTKSTPPFRIASISGSTLPLGMPKPRSMPAAFRVATIRSALFMDGMRLAGEAHVCHGGFRMLKGQGAPELCSQNADAAGFPRRDGALFADVVRDHVPDRRAFGALVD